MRISALLLIILTMALSACSNPHSAVIPSDISKWDTELKPVIQKLPDEEKGLLAGYLTRTKISETLSGATPPTGITVGTAIENQKRWIADQQIKEAEAKALKEKIEAERAALKKIIDDTLTVAVVDLYIQKADFRSGTYQDSQIIKLALHNKGNKDIKAVKGDMRFIDVFDKTVGKIGFGYDDGISAGETKMWAGARDYNQFIEEQRAIARLEEGKYTAVFEPEIIIFTDGTKLKASD